MGGLGTRFQQVGITTPKPLIEVDGVPMILKAVGSFANVEKHSDVALRHIFIIRKEHNEQFDLSNRLRAVLPSAVFVELDHNTGGAAETCLAAAGVIDADAPIVVMDCDLCFTSAGYESALLDIAAAGPAGPVSGLLLYFASRAPRYSYALLASDPSLFAPANADGSLKPRDGPGNRVVRTAEKVPISDHALIGAYGFASGELMLDASRRLVQRALDAAAGMKEYYLSLLYNILLADGRTVIAVPMDTYGSFGTPEELALYNSGQRSYMTE